jgi:hypothetical protein
VPVGLAVGKAVGLAVGAVVMMGVVLGSDTVGVAAGGVLVRVGATVGAGTE